MVELRRRGAAPVLPFCRDHAGHTGSVANPEAFCSAENLYIARRAKPPSLDAELSRETPEPDLQFCKLSCARFCIQLRTVLIQTLRPGARNSV